MLERLLDVAKDSSSSTLGAPLEKQLKAIQGLYALAFEHRSAEAVGSATPGRMGGENGWLEAWAERELPMWWLDEYLLTPEGKKLRERLDVTQIMAYEDAIREAAS